MIWVSILKRKPEKSDYYYWKGKRGYGGREYYHIETESFDFDKSVPVNKVADECLFWLDEENAQYEDVS